MAREDKSTIKGYFETGDIPTQVQFENLIDSSYNVQTDSQSNELISGNSTSLHKHSGANVTVNPESMVVLTGTSVQSQLEQTDQALVNARTTGIRYGGDLTVNSGNPNTFDVSLAVGQILDNTNPLDQSFYEVAYTAKTGITPQNEGINYVYYLPDDDTLYQSLTPPTYEDRIRRIYLGRAVLRSGVLAAIPQDKDYIQQIGIQMRSFAESVGQIRVSGLKHSANGANLSLNFLGGVMFDFSANGSANPHLITINSDTLATFQYYTRDSVLDTNLTSILPGNYNPTGSTVTSVGNNKYTIQDVYIFSSGNLRIQYGQNEYNTLDAARLGINSRAYVVNPTTNLGLRVGWIIVKNNTTSLLNTSDSLFVFSNKFGE